MFGLFRTKEALLRANKELLRKYETADLNFQKFQAQWREAQDKLNAMRDDFHPILQRYSLVGEMGWSLYDGDMVDKLCSLLIEARRTNKKLKRQLRLYRADTPEEIKAAVDDAIREIRKERHRWFPPPDRDVLRTLLNKVKRLRAEITMISESNGLRNVELDAMHYVWCNGGCHGGVHRFDEKGPAGVTEEIVQAAERNTQRLRQWFNNYQAKQKRG